MSRRLGRPLLACAAACAALLAAEAAWRVLRTTGYGPTTNPRYVLHDPLLGWRYRPGSRVSHVTREFDVEVAVNASGFRDEAFPPDGEAAGARILALGDSQTFGWGVPAEHAFPSVLERELGIDVLNMGVSGYGTDQELLLWRQRGRALRPDVVVLTVCANDTREVFRPAMYGREKPWFVLAGDRPELHGVPVPRHGMLERSHLLRSAWSAHLKSRNPPLQAHEVPAARALHAALLGTLAREILDAGGRLLVVAQDEPWLAATLPDLPDLAWLDVGADLAAGAGQGAVSFAQDPHWNARGHAIVARAVARAIRAEGWLP